METTLALSEAANAIPNLGKYFSELRTTFINRNGFLYACDYEARLNLDIIGAIDMEKIDVEAGTPSFTELVNSLETSAALAMIASYDRRHCRRLAKLLNKHWNPLEKPLEEEVEDPYEKMSVQNVLDNFSFAVRKIEALKRITRIAEKGNRADGGKIIKPLKLGVRINNINVALCAIRKCLKDVIAETEKNCLCKR
jgi:hypothetical protein